MTGQGVNRHPAALTRDNGQVGDKAANGWQPQLWAGRVGRGDRGRLGQPFAVAQWSVGYTRRVTVVSGRREHMPWSFPQPEPHSSGQA